MDATLHKDLDWISVEVCRHLWSLGTEGDNVCYGAPRLLIPHYTNDRPRISEQELRFIFAHVLESHLDGPYAYSVETPTLASHSFIGKTDRRISGQFDIGLHKVDGAKWKRICNVEFKAGQPPHVWQDFYKITKDWHKDESRPSGHYFHILESADSGTLPALLEKFAAAFQQVITRSLEEGLTGEIAPILITICILGSKVLSNQWACSFSINTSISHGQNDPAQQLLNGASTKLRGRGSLQDQKEYIRNEWKWNVIE